MELRTTSLMLEGLLPSDSLSDFEEKEFSEDEDDDRKHKHRRRETLSHKSEIWKNFYIAFLEKDFSGKFDKKRPGLAAFSRVPMELNKKFRANQSLYGEPVPSRDIGRKSISRSKQDSRFSSVTIASQMVQQGSVPGQSAFGLIPGIPNGGLETLHCLGLQGTLGPTVTPLMNIGIPRQRWRDFEERGFCLRGDMCPMEHGVNCIVVEDVQSLSQFNFPISLPSAQLLGAAARPGPLSSASAPSRTLMNSKSSKHGMDNDVLAFNGAFNAPADIAGADMYDPDEPLWTNDYSETSTALRALNPSRIDESEPLNQKSSDHHGIMFSDGSNDECPIRSNATAIGFRNTSLTAWGRIGNSKNRLEMKEKLDSMTSTPNYIENEPKKDRESLTNPEGMFLSLKKARRGTTGHNIRKPSQKPLRTLFVNGIPQKNNKIEALLSHFRRFGEVIDIHIPLNSERASVQFSKREEAEAALEAPDAVMGNRFIKLWWANRDNIREDRTSTGNKVSVNPHGLAVASVPYTTNRGKDDLQPATPKATIRPTSVAPPRASNHPRRVFATGLIEPPHLQKKLMKLEVLKEELRKKQQMLDQKRSDFRKQLDRLEKQVTKRRKVGKLADASKPETPRSSGTGTVVASPLAEVIADKKKSGENAVHHRPKTNSTLVPQEPLNLKPSIRPLAPLILNRFKLNNHPSAFEIIPPLPSGLANATVLKEHFSTYGALSNVELENLEPGDSEA